MDPSTRQPFERYIAIDAYKAYVMIGGLNAQRQVVLPLRKVSIGRFPKWAQANLKLSDALVIEATTNTWALHDQVAPLVGKAVVAHPPKDKLITSSQVRTDKTAGWALARLKAPRLLPHAQPSLDAQDKERYEQICTDRCGHLTSPVLKWCTPSIIAAHVSRRRVVRSHHAAAANGPSRSRWPSHSRRTAKNSSRTALSSHG
jgi:hypothetical protein